MLWTKIQWDDQERYTGMRLDDEKIQDIDFFRSKQDETTYLSFPPQQFTAGSDIAYDNKQFKLCTNLWFAEPGTHCGIHNEHSFIEIHTQILGVGCMQTFRNNKRETLCEDFIMAPGITTSKAFCHIKDDHFIYPYHQYYAETACVWLALEYHPL